MAGLSLEQISKKFPGNQKAVLSGIDLRVENGELLVLLGPSGCGKTTLLRIVAGLLQPDAGRVYIADEDVTQQPPGKRSVAMVFQDYAVYPHLSVRRNLSFGLEIRGEARSKIDKKVGEIAHALSLDEENLLDRFPSQIAGGQRQRVALGRAMAREPAVFLLDEPLSSLDPPLRARARSFIRDLHERLNATMLYVTHDQHEAMALGHRVAIIDGGRIQQEGPPEELYDRPANRIVAKFIGSEPMEFFEGEIQESSMTLRFCSNDVVTTIGVRLRNGVGKQVELGVRPEDLSLVDLGQGNVDGVVKSVTILGADCTVHVKLDTGRPVTIRSRRGASLAQGQRVGVSFPEQKIHLFDPKTGLRICE